MPPPSILSALLASPTTGLHERAIRPLEPAARRRVRARGGARIWHNRVGHQPVPDEQHGKPAHGVADETRALVEPVPTDGLADEGCDERAGDPEPGGQYETLRAIRTRRDETRDDAGDEADHDDPDNVRHDDLPVALAPCGTAPACSDRRGVSPAPVDLSASVLGFITGF